MSDNNYLGCPAMMSDGRFLTDFRSATTVNEHLKYINGLGNHTDYRMFLQKNAGKLIENEREYHKNTNRCFENECIHKSPVLATTPMFVDEMNQYNKIGNKPQKMSGCVKFVDYVMTETTPKKK